MKIAVPQEAIDIINHLHAAQFEAYLVGGCVRDVMLGRMPKDWDIVTDAQPWQILSVFPQAKMVGEKFGVALVNGHEVATFRAEGAYEDGRHPEKVVFVSDPELDSRRRDFTINALYYDPISEELLDFHRGMTDLAVNKAIRCIGDPNARFQEDHLRMLRAVRFCGKLQFNLHAETAAAIKANAKNILGIAAERVRMELSQILTQGRVDQSLRLMDEVGLLKRELPCVSKMQGVEQPKQFHPEGDVFQHTCLAVSRLKAGCSITLALGVLLHDVGKPVTATMGTDGNPRFFGHDKAGAELAQEFLSTKLKYPNEIVDRVGWLVAKHMRIYEVDKMRLAKVRRFIAQPGWEELVQLAECDTFGSMLPLEPHPVLSPLKNRPDWELIKERTKLPPCLINGDDLIAMGMKPGPDFKTVLSTILDYQLEGKLKTREEALDFAASFPEPEAA
jgi:poly(A) polymerase